MDSLEARIQAASIEYRRLLAVLTSTEHAAPQLAQQQDLISTLQADIATSDARVASAEARRLAEQSDHTRYRNSIFRRLAHKASGQSSRFSAKATNEESEYLAAVQAAHAEAQLNAALRSHLSAARSLADSLGPAAAQHAQAETDLAALLASLFDGPTLSHPDEDAAERGVSLELDTYRATLDKLNTESLALAHLKAAQLAMRAAVAAVRDAVAIAAQLEAFSDRDASDKRERAALAVVETHLVSARVSYMQAQRVKPDLKDMPALEVDQQGIMTAMYFAAPGLLKRGPTEFETMVRGLSDRVLEVGLFVKAKVEEVGAREGALKQAVKEREEALKAARERLMKVRERVFESVIGGEK